MAPRTEFTKYGEIAAGIVPKIACYKCERLVDRVDVEVDMLCGAQKFRAHCHGAVDTLTWSFEQQIDSGRFVGGIAFLPPALATPAIEPAPKPVESVPPQPARRIIFD